MTHHSVNRHASSHAPTHRASHPRTHHHPAEADPVTQRLQRAQHNRYEHVRHQCFRYAWQQVHDAGGKGIGHAPSDRRDRGQPISHLQTMIDSGHLKPGDVVYANRAPGRDPSSRNLRYGPHWFTYMGNGQFRDQYGTKTAAQMQHFIAGRRIDTVYHPFAHAGAARAHQALRTDAPVQGLLGAGSRGTIPLPA